MKIPQHNTPSGRWCRFSGSNSTSGVCWMCEPDPATPVQAGAHTPNQCVYAGCPTCCTPGPGPGDCPACGAEPGQVHACALRERFTVQTVAAHLVTEDMQIIKDRSGYDGTCLVWAPERAASQPSAAHAAAELDPFITGAAEQRAARAMTPERLAAQEAAAYWAGTDHAAQAFMAADGYPGDRP
jgi:hypothetical protein